MHRDCIPLRNQFHDRRCSGHHHSDNALHQLACNRIYLQIVTTQCKLQLTYFESNRNQNILALASLHFQAQQPMKNHTRSQISVPCGCVLRMTIVITGKVMFTKMLHTCSKTSQMHSKSRDGCIWLHLVSIIFRDR
jgi:hypothetical protein